VMRMLMRSPPGSPRWALPAIRYLMGGSATLIESTGVSDSLTTRCSEKPRPRRRKLEIKPSVKTSVKTLWLVSPVKLRSGDTAIAIFDSRQGH
jgi:hypothetical protein